MLISVDDGYVDDVRTVLPDLQRFHMVATFFVITGRMTEPGFLSAEQIRELDRAGMDVGDHTAHHVDLRVLTPSELRVETAGSRQVLQGVLGRYAGTRMGRQELDGEIIEDRPDALWSRGLIEDCRVNEAPHLQRIVVAVDPPVSSGKRADSCGIVAAGIAEVCKYLRDDADVRFDFLNCITAVDYFESDPKKAAKTGWEPHLEVVYHLSSTV
ncbi:hypothetical protein B4Q13_19675, partial [Lacticaseibacillus rhamnosus]